VKQDLPQMLIPLPAPPQQIGPPSDYALSRSPLMALLLVLQTAACIGRIFFLLDILGGFIMVIMVVVGWCGWAKNMHITFISYWGMLCLINGIFDMVRFIDLAVNHAPVFSKALGFRYNFMSSIHLAVPLVTLPGALLAWFLYRSLTADAIYDDAYQPAAAERQPLVPRGAPRDSQFQPFAGSGQRLGGT